MIYRRPGIEEGRAVVSFISVSPGTEASSLQSTRPASRAKVFAAFYDSTELYTFSHLLVRSVQYTKLVILPRLTCTRKGCPLKIINPWDQASSPLCCLAPTPPPRSTGDTERKRDNLLTAKGGGSKSCDGEKVWSSIIFNTLCLFSIWLSEWPLLLCDSYFMW